MNPAHRNPFFLTRSISRRELLRRASGGFGALALSALFGGDVTDALAGAVAKPPQRPLAPKPPHFPAKARSVIFLFMEGAVSQVDSFDYKPMLEKYHGQDPRK